MTMTEDYATANGHDGEHRSDNPDTVTLDDGQGGEMTVNRKAWKQLRSLVDVLDSTDAKVFGRAVDLAIADSLKPAAQRPAPSGAAPTTTRAARNTTTNGANGAK